MKNDETLTQNTLENKREKRILVVEDNPMQQFITKALLKKLGCDPSVVSDGTAAIQALRDSVYDLVLLDSQMPGIDCLQTAKIIRSASSGVTNPNVPIIALTNTSENLDKEQCRAFGINECVSKPVTKDTIEKYLKPLLNTTSIPRCSTVSVSSPKARTLPVFDMAELMDRLSNDVSLARTLMSIFSGNFKDTYAKLSEDIHNGDYESARKQAHTLAGAASNIGARALSQVAREIESIAKSGKLPEQALLEKLLLEEADLRLELSKEGLV